MPHLPSWFGVYAITLFVSAWLLFQVQPIEAKMLLPSVGGAPAVWNACVLFFQMALLAGYGYVHLTTRLLSPRPQWLLHGSLALLVLVRVSLEAPASEAPPDLVPVVSWTLGRLAWSAGPPFFVLAASAPLLQRWLTATQDPNARNPFPLYAASNLGSLGGLLTYPFVLEPLLPLGVQRGLWVTGYAACVVLLVVCGLPLARRNAPARPQPDGQPEPAGPVERTRRWRWLALSAIPSSLMLGVTSHLSEDVGGAPFLWVLPLAIYLLTFVLTFGRSRPLLHRWICNLFPITALAVLLSILTIKGAPLAVLLPLHLFGLFHAAMLCHGELARTRPAARQLTGFYLLIAAGGAIGGVFNTLLAPLLFSTALEYPLALIVAAGCRPRPSAPALGHDASPIRIWRRGFAAALVPAALAGVGSGAMQLEAGQAASDWILKATVGTPFVAAAGFAPAPGTFPIALASAWIAGSLQPELREGGVIEATHRNFFGSRRIVRSDDGRYRMLVHGNTIHGMQATDPARRREPLTYYHPDGPAGDIFTAVGSAADVAVIGLGTGSLACYAGARRDFTFFELDPDIVTLARDSGFFTFLEECAPSARIVIGDARRQLRAAARGSFDLIVVDAFSSDAIPVHLLTLEALELYLQKTAPGGLIALHLSNRHFDFERVLGPLAMALGLQAFGRQDDVPGEAAMESGRFGSFWVVLGRTMPAQLRGRAEWEPLTGAGGSRLWTDDYSSLLTLIVRPSFLNGS